MLTLKNRRHVRTMRNIKSFRSCPNATGVSMQHLDRARIRLEQERLALREKHRVRTAEQWTDHFEHIAGPLRVLPPAARTQETKKQKKRKTVTEIKYGIR